MSSLRRAFGFTALCCAAATAGAQAPSYTVKQIAATYAEAPPGRDKALATPMQLALEKVETTAVVEFKNRIVADVPTFNEDAVSVTALMPGGGRFELGKAEISAFRRVSDDKRKVALTMGVTRLPDQPAKGVHFGGNAVLWVASGSKSKQLEFKPQPGTRLDAGFGAFTLAKIEDSTLTFEGGESLSRLHGVKLVRDNGSTVSAERGTWGRIGSKVTQEWRLQGPSGPGRLEFTYYDNLERLALPLDLVVAKPF